MPRSPLLMGLNIKCNEVIKEQIGAVFGPCFPPEVFTSKCRQQPLSLFASTRAL